MDEHPLDEAQGYAALIELQLDTYPIVEAIQKMVAEVTGESAGPGINGKADLSPRCFCKKRLRQASCWFVGSTGLGRASFPTS